MNNIEVFKNNEFGQIRTILVNNIPYFVGKDISIILGYKNNGRDVARHVDEEDRLIYHDGTFESNRGLTIINESGLYSLVLSSKMPRAKEFKHWVTSDVLPSIRKHGAYITDKTIDEIATNPDLLIKLANELKKEKEEKEKALNTISEERPMVIFAKSIKASRNSILVGELAKIIKQNGYDIGQNRLFKCLRDNGYLGKNKGYYNIPTQYSMKLGLFEIDKRALITPNGVKSFTTSKVTGKGQAYFINKFIV